LPNITACAASGKEGVVDASPEAEDESWKEGSLAGAREDIEEDWLEDAEPPAEEFGVAVAVADADDKEVVTLLASVEDGCVDTDAEADEGESTGLATTDEEAACAVIVEAWLALVTVTALLEATAELLLVAVVAVEPCAS
jgi:hypothetical protein